LVAVAVILFGGYLTLGENPQGYPRKLGSMIRSQFTSGTSALSELNIMHQMSPMGGQMNQPDYTLIIVATASLVIIAVSVILLLFPRLQGMASTESIRPVIEREESRVEEADNGIKVVEVAMRLLEPDEKRVMEALVAAGGSMLQKDLSHELGFSRVKTHRVLVKLIRRSVVTAEKYYNTNRIEVAGWLSE